MRKVSAEQALNEWEASLRIGLNRCALPAENHCLWQAALAVVAANEMMSRAKLNQEGLGPFKRRCRRAYRVLQEQVREFARTSMNESQRDDCSHIIDAAIRCPLLGAVVQSAGPRVPNGIEDTIQLLCIVLPYLVQERS